MFVSHVPFLECNTSIPRSGGNRPAEIGGGDKGEGGEKESIPEITRSGEIILISLACNQICLRQAAYEASPFNARIRRTVNS